MKMQSTKWPELQFAHVEAYNVTLRKKESFWSFFNEGSRVGAFYPTRETLVADMPRYASENWGLN